jgi:nitrate reductase delta subunit
MMDEKVIMVVLARILNYPDTTFLEECSSIKTFIQEFTKSEEIRLELTNMLEPLFNLNLKELQEIYVESFDYKEKTNLYLTAHEMGDSKKRGFALIQLQNLIRESGFDYSGYELADYIPLLLELLAVAPVDDKFDTLSRRVAYALNRIYTSLPDSNLYKAAIELLIRYVFEAPGKEEMSKLELLREQADMEELPYPLMYR